MVTERLLRAGFNYSPGNIKGMTEENLESKTFLTSLIFGVQMSFEFQNGIFVDFGPSNNIVDNDEITGSLQEQSKHKLNPMQTEVVP